MKLACRFGFHDWLPWGELVQTYGAQKQQWRSCADCNKIQSRSLAEMNQANVSECNNSLAVTSAAVAIGKGMP